MPKKFGSNQKAEEAKARKNETKNKQKEEHDRNREDAKWVDADKQAQAKERRRLEQEAKRIEQLQRKAENKLLADQEMEKIAKTTKGPRAKPTQAQIQENQRSAMLASLKAKVEAAKPAEEPTTALDDCVNPNYSETPTVEAHSIEEALQATESSTDLDSHPERRRRKAFNDYLEEKIPEYRKLYPTMKRKQLVNLLFKEFQTAEENPMNKPHAAYNEVPQDR